MNWYIKDNAIVCMEGVFKVKKYWGRDFLELMLVR